MHPFMLTGLGSILALSSLVAQARKPRSPEVQEFVSVDAPVVALTHVRVIDGTGAAARDDQTVIIRGTKIEAVGPAGSVKTPPGAKVVDGTGHSVIPGLIGMHDHTFYTTHRRMVQSNFTAPRLYLAAGVTTIRTWSTCCRWRWRKPTRTCSLITASGSVLTRGKAIQPGMN